MSKKEKLLQKVLFSTNDKNIKFDDIVTLLKSLEFELTIKGSHHIFSKKGVPYKPNIQKDGNMLKSFQVKQIRNMIFEFKLWENI